ncbi:hypothetical protein GCM10010293_42600 [Streptomyces griseoflavus]|nr:hypothetical protein GCM10010293_42600 [Streptomyces griseoflavus]
MFWSQPNPCTSTTVRPEAFPVTRMLFLRWMLIRPCSHDTPVIPSWVSRPEAPARSRTRR